VRTNNETEWVGLEVMPQTYIREVLGSNAGQDAGRLRVVVLLRQSLQANVGTVPQLGLVRLSLPIHLSRLDAPEEICITACGAKAKDTGRVSCSPYANSQRSTRVTRRTWKCRTCF
jgi:hypothetical protein